MSREPDPPPASGGVSRRRFLELSTAASVAMSSKTLTGRTITSLFEKAAPIKKGGTLNVGMLGGGAAETIDPNKEVNEIDIARVYQLYERLVTYDPLGRPKNQLAQEFSSNKTASVWKVKLLPGVRFHDGSPLTAQDVVYSLKYMLAHPASAGHSDVANAFVTASGLRALDSSTVEITLSSPNAVLPTGLAARTIWIFKNGMTDFTKPNGTGPFKYSSFTAGEQSVFVRNPYYRDQEPYLDAVRFTSFTSDSSLINALASGVIDAAGAIEFADLPTIQGHSNLKVLRAKRAFTTTMTMSTNMKPFTDNRVRQAFRLMVDREQMVENAVSGNGIVGNDLFWPTDPDYDTGIPQRAHDPEQAKSLLKQAGQSDLSVSLYTSTASIGQLQSATLFVSQAKLAGVNVSLNNVPADQYYSDLYLKTPFAQGGWSLRPLLTQWSQVLNTGCFFPETHWNNPKFNGLSLSARRTLDPNKRHQLMNEAQQILWNEGGYIIWGFYDAIDGYSDKVHGLYPSSSRWLGQYDFRKVYLT